MATVRPSLVRAVLTWIIAVIALATCSSCGASRSPNAQSAGPKPARASHVCAVLRSSDINGATRLGVGTGTPTADAHGCSYVNTANGAVVTVVSNAGGAGRYDDLRSTQGAHDVSGVGDKAFVIAAGGGIVAVDLYVVHGSDLVLVSMSTPQSAADVGPATQDAERIARIVLGRS
jgi:hypothetical protein